MMNEEMRYTRYLGNSVWSDSQRFAASLDSIQEAVSASTLANLDALIELIKVPDEQDTYVFTMSPIMKERIEALYARSMERMRWYQHYERTYRLPSRKLRKCHIRKMERRRQRERRLWI